MREYKNGSVSDMKRSVVILSGMCLVIACSKAMYELGHFTFFDEV